MSEVREKEGQADVRDEDERIESPVDPVVEILTGLVARSSSLGGLSFSSTQESGDQEDGPDDPSMPPLERVASRGGGHIGPLEQDNNHNNNDED